MSKLAAALAWAQRGFAVFPLRENSKKPVHDEDWNSIATTDPERIRQLWTDLVTKYEHNYNIGCACTDMVVIDVDIKDGKDGINDYLQMGGVWDTLLVQTPTGGYHCYFYGPDSSNASLSDAVDVRSHRGYVVAPGSVIDGAAYTVVADNAMRWVPDTIERRLEGPKVRNVESQAQAIDSAANIEAGRNFLETAPPAVEGMRGDETTFITAAKLVREFSLSVSTAFALMRDVWNPKCKPPWQPAELYTKVENAYQYGTADAGRLSAETLYGHLQVIPPPNVFSQVASFGNAYLGSQLRPRPWLVDDMLMRRTVTLLLASGSAGKSSLSLALAAHLAVGANFAGYKVRQACRTIVYNGEDDVEEQSRRLTAVCTIYGLDYEEVRKHILLLSAREMKLQLVSKEGGRAVRNDTVVEQLTKFAAESQVGCIILDPLVKLHQCDESDNAEMDTVMEAIADIAHHANTAMLVLHHTTKMSMKQEDRVGNADIARGASAIVNAARVAFTMMNASSQDAQDYGFDEEERHRWVRLDDAKMNMSLANKTATWFHKETQVIVTGDAIGVLKYEERKHDPRYIMLRVANAINSYMVESHKASDSLDATITAVMKRVPGWKNKKLPEARNEMKVWFASQRGVAVESGAIVKIIKDDNDKLHVTVS